jgi:predicted enzyme related to lactoylglutathione lyase
MQSKRSVGFRQAGWILFFLNLLMGITVLAGCGSNDPSAPPPVLTGTFVDSPVSGLSYQTASQSGITGADGSFLYRAGETVIFSAGEIVLGSTQGKTIVTPVDLASGVNSSANMKAVNLCRFLQLIDADANHANGIEITVGIRALLTWNPANGDNDGSIFQNETSIFLSTGTFAVFMSQVLATLNGGSVFTAVTPRLLTTRSATGARRNLNTMITAMSPHPFSPYVKEVGIGVTDLNASMSFYENVMGLRFVDYQGKTDRVEAIYEDNRTSATNRVALMQFNNSGIVCTNQPVKLVFAVPNADAAYAAILAGGGSGFSAPAVQPGLGKIGLALDPDGYLLELIEAASVPGAYLSGIGIGVASIQVPDDFYTRVLGMKFNYYLYVAGFMNEMIMQSPLSGASSFGMDIVLMDYFNDTGRVYTNVPVKIVFTVADPAMVLQAVADEGLDIIQTPSANVRGVAKDPNGYEIEVSEAPPL